MISIHSYVHFIYYWERILKKKMNPSSIKSYSSNILLGNYPKDLLGGNTPSYI